MQSPLPPRLILHCGANKTGTTAVQVACHNGRDILKSMGILYPDLNVKGVITRSHFPLAVAFQKTPETYYVMKDNGFDAAAARAYATEIKQAFLSQIASSGCDTVFVSSEAIGLLHPDELTQMHAFFDDHFRQIDAVYYARPPVDSLLSFLQEYIKGGITPDMTKLAAAPHMLFGQTAHKLKCQFGDILKLRLFERSSLYNRDILSDVFHTLLGITELPPGLGGQKTNASLSAPAAAMLYFANREVPRRLNGKVNPLFTRLGIIAGEYTKSYSNGQKLALPSETWATFIRKELGADYHLFLCHAGQDKLAQNFARQLIEDRHSHPNLEAPTAAQTDQWMRDNIDGFRFDLIPSDIAQIVQRGIKGSAT